MKLFTPKGFRKSWPSRQGYQAERRAFIQNRLSQSVTAKAAMREWANKDNHRLVKPKQVIEASNAKFEKTGSPGELFFSKKIGENLRLGKMFFRSSNKVGAVVDLRDSLELHTHPAPSNLLDSVENLFNFTSGYYVGDMSSAIQHFIAGNKRASVIAQLYNGRLAGYTVYKKAKDFSRMSAGLLLNHYTHEELFSLMAANIGNNKFYREKFDIRVRLVPSKGFKAVKITTLSNTQCAVIILPEKDLPKLDKFSDRIKVEIIKT